jgi:hypothetical protein
MTNLDGVGFPRLRVGGFVRVVLRRRLDACHGARPAHSLKAREAFLDLGCVVMRGYIGSNKTETHRWPLTLSRSEHSIALGSVLIW